MQAFKITEYVLRFFDKLMTALGALLVALIPAIVVVQVIARLLRSPFSWAEETAQYCLVTLVFVGSSIVEGDDSHVSVDSILSLFPDKLIFILRMISKITLVLILVFVLISEYTLWPHVSKLRSPAGNIPMSLVHFILGTGIAWWLVKGIQSWLLLLKEKRKQH